MPPPGRPAQTPATSHALAIALEQDIDRAWMARPNPGRIAAVHRLNRAEYNNAIRDLLALDIDVKPLLPGDETADGQFDNSGSLSISQRISTDTCLLPGGHATCRGHSGVTPPVAISRNPLHVISGRSPRVKICHWVRAVHRVRHDFRDGEYFIKVRLQRHIRTT